MSEKPEEKQETPAAPETKVETPAAPEAKKPEEKKEQTVAEILDDKGGKKEETPKTVPEAAFLDEKKGRKAAEDRVKELESIIQSGASKGEIAAEIEDIAKKHNVDSGFLRDFAQSIENKVKAATAKEVEERVKPLTERERKDKMNQAFETHFASAMEQMPEFKGVVNKEVIRKLTLDPDNREKTFKQIIEDAYGTSVPGRRTIETTKPGASKEAGEIDYSRIHDSKYFNEVMANPDLKKKYNEGLIGRMGSAL